MLIAALAGACAANPSSGASTTPAASALSAPEEGQTQAELERELMAQREENSALREELSREREERARLEADQRARAERETSRTATIRIANEGDRPEPTLVREGDVAVREAPAIGPEAWIEPDEGAVAVSEAPSNGPRPVLRLRGEPAPEEAPIPLAAAGTVPAIPDAPPAAGVPLSPAAPAAPLTTASASLPVAVAPLPTSATAPVPQRPSTTDPGVVAYRRALGLLRDRRYGDAVQAFDGFLREHPQHAYSANAAYWRAESLYAARRYDDARRAFEAFTQRFPRHPKAADALLKVGLCFSRAGSPGRAAAYFRRVREEYPGSVAARMAAREEAS